MDYAEAIQAYEKIIESLRPLTDHTLPAVALLAQTQINSNLRCIHELKIHQKLEEG